MSNTLTLTLGGAVELRLVQAPPAPSVRPLVTVRFAGFSLTAEGTHMAYTLPDDNFVKVRIDYVDAAGHPATVDGLVAWSSSDPTIATVAVDPEDSQQATVTPAGGALGNCQIKADADADLGSGTTTITSLMDLTVVAGQAVAGTITPVGPPEPITPPGRAA